MKLLNIFLLVLTITTHAQMAAGFTIEGTGVVTDKHSYLFPVTGIGILLGYSALPDLHFEARFGYDMTMIEYKGANYSMFMLYDIFNPLYLTANISLHSNDGSSDEGVALTKVTLIGAGAGVKITSALSFELIYNFPLQTKIWLADYTILRENVYFEKLTGVIKANWKFRWDF